MNVIESGFHIEGNVDHLDLGHSREKWPLSPHMKQVVMGSGPVPVKYVDLVAAKFRTVQLQYGLLGIFHVLEHHKTKPWCALSHPDLFDRTKFAKCTHEVISFYIGPESQHMYSVAIAFVCWIGA